MEEFIITEEKVHKLLTNVNLSELSGSDNIPGTFMKNSEIRLAQHVIQISNQLRSDLRLVKC